MTIAAGQFRCHLNRNALRHGYCLLIKSLFAQLLGIDPDNFLMRDRNRDIVFSIFIGDVFTGSFPVTAHPVVKGAGINVVFLTPLIIGKSALAAFHDQL